MERLHQPVLARRRYRNVRHSPGFDDDFRRQALSTFRGDACSRFLTRPLHPHIQDADVVERGLYDLVTPDAWNGVDREAQVVGAEYPSAGKRQEVSGPAANLADHADPDLAFRPPRRPGDHISNFQPDERHGVGTERRAENLTLLAGRPRLPIR